MPLAVQRQQSLCGSKGMVSRMPTIGRAQKFWGGTWVDDGRDVGAGGHHRDLAMAWQLYRRDLAMA